MKNLKYLCLCLILILMTHFSTAYALEGSKRKPVNYTVILDLSDRVLNEGQLKKDFLLIRNLFQDFETKARRGLILTSKDRFSIKIIPQNGSPLNTDFFENNLQLKLDEIPVQSKNKKMEEFTASFGRTLEQLEEQARIGKSSSDYFGVDIWAYLNDSGRTFDKEGYKNLVLIATDGYFDFENTSHVIHSGNRYTSTRFLKDLSGLNWKEKAEKENYGLIPVDLKGDVEWVISGISSKNKKDILQNKKITYFWEKWLKESGATKYNFILNNSGSQMASRLLSIL